MTEDEPHPLTRMATIKSPSFWIFFGTCVALYVYNKSLEANAADVVKYAAYGNYVCLAAFGGLFLTLIADAVKKPGPHRFISIVCYVFQIASIGCLGVMIVMR